MLKLRKMIRNSKYRYKILVVCLLCGILPLVIIGLFAFHGFRNILIDREYESMDAALDQMIDTVGQEVTIIDNLLNYYLSEQELQKVVSTEQKADFDTYDTYVNDVDPLLASFMYYHPEIQQITIYSDQVQIPHDVTIAPLIELEEESWYSELLTSSDVNWYWPDDSRTEIVAMKRFQRYYSGYAYLGVFCNLDQMVESLSYFQKEGGGVVIADETGSILYAYGRDAGHVNDLSLEMIHSDYTYREKGITELPLTICIYMDEASIYAGFYEMGRKIILLLLLCLAAIIAVGMQTSFLLVRRIRNLTDIVEHMDIETQISIEDDAEDEIGILVRSFKTSMDEIHRLVNEVYKGKITQQELEMKALQAQINPHFLYNSLSLINWMAIANDEEEISQITLALSDYYRTTLNKGENFITIKDEILNIQSYLKIQLMMHDYEFSVTYNLAEGLEKYIMPKLVLQPIVENALEHGLDVKEEPDKQLFISCVEDEKDIVWTIRDNGVGMDAATLEDLLHRHKGGYGVRNVFERLRRLYGDEYGLAIASEPGNGTSVQVRIPKK